MATRSLLTVALVSVLVSANLPGCASSAVVTASVTCAQGSTVRASRACNLAWTNTTARATAWGWFSDTVVEKGWGELKVHSNQYDFDTDQAFAAGYLEGALTSKRIYEHWENFYEATFGTGDSFNSTIYDTAVSFVTGNDQFVRSQIKQRAANMTQDVYWYQMMLIWLQLDGMLAGYNAVSPHAQLTLRDLLLLNAYVDLSSLINKPFLTLDDPKWTDELAREHERRTTHCSAIVKLSADYSELWTSHNTWTGYFTMLRIAKTYDLALHNTAGDSWLDFVPARQVLFSGYPGILASTDDFFVLSSRLTVIETTNSVYNKTLLDTIQPKCVLTWARSILANRIATDGPSWVEAFKPYNSGTINNQWIIVDYNLFEPHQPLKPNTLWVLEQIPTYIEAADMTRVLQYGYWPSYNRPYFPKISAMAGQDAMEGKFGSYYSYDLYARAEIFRRDQGGVRSRDDLKRLMRYNDWERDPLSVDPRTGAPSPELAIAARYDLDPTAPKAFGNTDAKFVGREQALNVGMECTSGPSHDTQPVFSWTGPWGPTKIHHGHPTSYDFGWYNFTADEYAARQDDNGRVITRGGVEESNLVPQIRKVLSKR